MSVMKFHEYNVRVVNDEDVWFHLGDVCKVLDIQNPRKIAAKLREVDGVSTRYAIDSIGRKQKTNFVKEEFLYFDVIPKSRKPIAREFCKWARNVLKKAVRELPKALPMTPELIIENRKSITESRKSITESRKVLLQALQVFGHDDRLRQYIQDSFTNEHALPEPKLLSVSEILKEHNWDNKSILKFRIALGRLIAKEFRERHNTEPATCKKFVNGHRVEVKVYSTSDQDWVMDTCEQFRVSRNLGQ